jgi:hypothetical protein
MVYHLLNRGNGRPPVDWVGLVNRPQSEAEEAALEQSIRRDRPYRVEGWVESTAIRLGLTHTLRGRGRPRTPTLYEAKTMMSPFLLPFSDSRMGRS